MFAIFSFLVGCAMHVPVEKVYGEYLASYPYGTETLKLNRDGTFVQTVVINRGNPVVAGGTWEFDQSDSRVTLYGAMSVDNGFGNLRSDWQRTDLGLWSEDVELHWFRVEMGSAEAYPLFKQ
jgi:hypothetical protein